MSPKLKSLRFYFILYFNVVFISGGFFFFFWTTGNDKMSQPEMFRDLLWSKSCMFWRLRGLFIWKWTRRLTFVADNFFCSFGVSTLDKSFLDQLFLGMEENIKHSAELYQKMRVSTIDLLNTLWNLFKKFSGSGLRTESTFFLLS